MIRIVSVLVGGWACMFWASGHLQAIGPQQQQPSGAAAQQQISDTSPSSRSPQRALLDQYCVTCHNQKLKTAGLTLDTMDVTHVGEHAEVWEKVVRKLRGGLMPPAGRPRPDHAAYDGFALWLETELDRAAEARPNPGRTQTFHRLNRAEYSKVVRDVLALDIDVASLLPPDSASYGFDNMAGVLKVSQALLERYLSAARKISRAAIGTAAPSPAAETYKVPLLLPQDERLEGLPFGTRGGTLIHHLFPQDAEYVFRFELSGVANGAELEFLVDGERVRLFTVKPGRRAENLDGYEEGENLEVRVPVKAGPREIGVAFLKTPSLLAEANRRPFLNPKVSRPARAYLTSVTITGPFGATGVGDTPSRQRIFVCRPASPASPAAEAGCAKTILSTLARRAYRRPVTDEDLKTLLIAYKEGRTGADFEAGIERALQQLLVSPEFLFRVEADPANLAAAMNASAAPNYRLSDLELASRLSFLLWSSVPDDELIDVAAQGKLKDPVELERQIRRMLGDTRAEALTSNFVGQWLQLRNLESVTPSLVLFPDFDDGLRQGFRRETELFFDSIVREDRSVVDLLTADYTFLNARLARHYGIPHVKGSHFRRVTLSDPNRGGLLGQGSILTVTSQPVRTSPVARGKWILENILGTPPPPPLPNVPPLPDKTGAYAGKMLSMRERMAAHRSNPVCASCHSMIDPLGFGLEHFDAVGMWRDVDDMFGPIDASGVLPDGTTFNGVAELKAALVKRPERFVTTLTEKLLTYALGRGLEYYDMPAVRKIVRDAAPSDYKLSSLILGIANSLPFQMRRLSS